jgi:hypothetical protein
MSQLQVTGEAKIRDIQGPVVANDGVITALDGAANQYVRGDGTLASFPTSGGGGSSVSYYLNGSVNQGTFGGSTYYQMSKNAIVGTGTNFSTSANGLIAQFITDANDPDVVSIPSGNWNIEFFMSVSASSGALASFYVEIYKYDGSTFTLLATNVATPEQLTNTTTVDAYFTSVAMPLSAMALTDRLAVRVFANVASKTVTLYTEDNRLCQVVTTFSKGILSISGLTDQSQNLTTGTSGTNFAIVSSGDTHTFNLPVASATNTGKLSSTDWSTFNNKQNALTNPITGTGANGNVAYFDGTTSITSENSFNYDASTNRLGVNTTVPNATIGANAGIDSGYSLLLKSDNANYNGIGFGTDSTYGNLISTEKLGTASARNLTLLNQSGFVSLTEAGNLGLGLLTPNTGLDIYNGSNAYLWLHTATSGITGTDGVRLALFSTNGANLRNFDGSFSITAEGDFSIITIGAENFRVNSSDGSIYQSKVANAMLKSVSGVITAAVAGTDYLAPASISGTTNTISKFTSSSALGNSNITDTGSLITLGSTSYVSSGNFGVGTATPSVSGVGIDIYSATSSSLRFHTATSGTTVSDGAGINFSAGNNLGITNYESGTIDIVTNGNSGVYIDSSGNVGIKGATPTTALTVNGGAAISALTTGQIVFPTSGGTLAGSSNLFWDNTNAKLGIGTSTLSGARVTISSTTEANHLQLVSNAPAMTFINAISYSYYATVGMATASNNFITGAVQGDLVLGAYNTSNIWFYNANTNTVRMRIDGDGGGTFSSFVSASGPKSQIRVNGNSVGCGILLSNTIVGANRRNWAIFTEENVEGDFVIERSTTYGGTPNTPVLSLSRDGAATFSSSVTINSGSSDAAFLANTTGLYSYFSVQKSNAVSTVGRWNMQLRGDSYFGNTANALIFLGERFNSSSVVDGYYVPLALQPNGNVIMCAGSNVLGNGNVGIGTSSPTNYSGYTTLSINNATSGGVLDLLQNGTSAFRVATDGTGNSLFGASNQPMSFYTNSSERMRITSGGNVGIGTSSPNGTLAVKTDASANGINIWGRSDDFAVLRFQNSAGSFSNATIYATPTYLAFETAAAERMRITSGGNVLIGTTTDTGQKLQVNGEVGSTGSGSALTFKDRTGPNVFVWYATSGIPYFFNTAVGNIASISPSTGVYTPLSDINKKKDLEESTIGLNAILGLKPTLYRMKGDETEGGKELGFIAQEVKEFIPQAYVESKDFIGLNYNAIVAALVKSVQEQQAQIEELKELIKNK